MQSIEPLPDSDGSYSFDKLVNFKDNEIGKKSVETTHSVSEQMNKAEEDKISKSAGQEKLAQYTDAIVHSNGQAGALIKVEITLYKPVFSIRLILA